MPEATLEFSSAGVTEADLVGFFVGWPSPPSPAERLAILTAADEVVVARSASGSVVGFATAITDGRFAAYIPLLEVLPEHQGAGIGSRLILALFDRLRAHYMIDLACDDDVVGFYERLGGGRGNAVVWRNYERLRAPDKAAT